MERQELKAVLLEMVENETGEKLSELSESADLRRGLKLDSLDMVSLILEIESRLKIAVRTEELQQLSTVGDLLDVLHKKLQDAAASKAA
jgi:acyl carrier protein